MRNIFTVPIVFLLAVRFLGCSAYTSAAEYQGGYTYSQLLTQEEANTLDVLVDDARLWLRVGGGCVEIEDRGIIKACLANLQPVTSGADSKATWYFYKHFERIQDEDGETLRLGLLVSDRKLSTWRVRLLLPSYWRRRFGDTAASPVAACDILREFTEDMVSKSLRKIPNREISDELPGAVRDGEIVLIRTPSSVIALILGEQKADRTEGLKWSWYVFKGQNPDLGKKPDESGEGQRYGDSFVRIPIKSITVEWTSCTDGWGYLEYTNRRTVEIALTGKTKLEDIDLVHDRLVFARSVSHYLRQFGVDKWLARLWEARKATTGEGDPFLLNVHREAEESLLACALLAATLMEGDDFAGGWMAAVAELYAQSGQKEEALEILAEAAQNVGRLAARSRRDRSAGFLNVNALGRLAEGYASIGEKERAAAVASEALEEAKNMRDDLDSEAVAFLAVADVFAAAGRYEEALRLARSLEKSEYRAIALGKIALRYAKEGKKEEAAKISTECAQVAQKTTKASSKSEALSYIALSQIAVGDVSSALVTTELMPVPSLKSGLLVEIAMEQANTAQKDEAFEQLSKAVHILRRLDNDWDKPFRLSEIANASFQLDDAGRTSALLPEMLAIAEAIPDPRYKARALAAVAPAYWQVGAKHRALGILSQALAIAEAVSDMLQRDEALRSVAAGFASIEQYERAFEVATMIDESNSWDTAMGLISMSYAVRGDMVEALRTIRKIEDLNGKVWPLHTVASWGVQNKRVPTDVEKKILCEIARDLDIQRWWEPQAESRFSETVTSK